MPSKKHKNDKDGASITPTTTKLTQLTKKGNQGEKKMWLRKPTHLLYHQKRILSQSKNQRNHKHPKKQLITPKTIKPIHLTKNRNQGLLQKLIYLLKVTEYK